MSLTLTPSHPLRTDGRQGFDLFPSAFELTVAQAAEFPDGSEDFVDKLLNGGLIAFRLKNGERLIQRNSMLNFVHERERGHAALDGLFHLFREAELSDDDDG